MNAVPKGLAKRGITRVIEELDSDQRVELPVDVLMRTHGKQLLAWMRDRDKGGDPCTKDS